MTATCESSAVICRVCPGGRASLMEPLPARHRRFFSKLCVMRSRSARLRKLIHPGRPGCWQRLGNDGDGTTGIGTLRLSRDSKRSWGEIGDPAKCQKPLVHTIHLPTHPVVCELELELDVRDLGLGTERGYLAQNIHSPTKVSSILVNSQSRVSLSVCSLANR
jgi:hypothetical protein